MIADDTDILVLIVYHIKPTMGDAYMLKTATGKKKESELVNIKNIQTAVRQFFSIHALSGYDTTSALFGIRKVSAFHNITEKRDSVYLTEIFSSDTVTSNDVAEAGAKLLVMLYG